MKRLHAFGHGRRSIVHVAERAVKVVQNLQHREDDFALAALRRARPIAFHPAAIIVKIGQRSQQGIVFAPQLFFESFDLRRRVTDIVVHTLSLIRRFHALL